MFKIIRKIFTNRTFLDVLGLIPPLSMVILSFVSIVTTRDIRALAQVFIVAYFLTIFLIRFISMILRKRASEHEEPLKGNIIKANIMISAGTILLIESIAIFAMSIYVTLALKDKGVFGSSLLLALTYVIYFLVRLILNLIKILSQLYKDDYYDKTIMYLETVTLFYIMVVAFSYLMSALSLNVDIFNIIVSVFAFLGMLVTCILMLIMGTYNHHYSKRLLKKDIKSWKKSGKEHRKELKRLLKINRNKEKDNV